MCDKKLISIMSITTCLLLGTTSLVTAGITVKVVDINNEPVEDMVVYLLPLEQQNMKKLNIAPLIIQQLDKKFTPYISVIKKGLPLTFVNDDEITHQIYSASAKNRFSFRIKSGAEKKIRSLSVTGKVLMGCNIHDWMSGYLMVLDTPWYTKTNFNGESVLSVTGKGAYQLVVWHPQLGEKDQKVSQQITLSKDKHYLIKLTKKMNNIPSQENPGKFDFLEIY